MDGIDASIVKSDGEQFIEIIKLICMQYYNDDINNQCNINAKLRM